MFALRPSGGESDSSSGRSGIYTYFSNSPVTLFFGKLGIYFGIIRLSYLFFSSGDQKKAIET